MKEPVDSYWKKRIEKCKEAFEENNFQVYTADTKEDVKNLIMEEIFPKLHFKSVSWGDSMSMISTGIIQEVENLPNVLLLKTF